jgi:hypothetical protein
VARRLDSKEDSDEQGAETMIEMFYPVFQFLVALISCLLEAVVVLLLLYALVSFAVLLLGFIVGMFVCFFRSDDIEEQRP